MECGKWLSRQMTTTKYGKGLPRKCSKGYCRGGATSAFGEGLLKGDVVNGYNVMIAFLAMLKSY